MGMNLEQWLQFQQQVHPRDIALGLERIELEVAAENERAIRCYRRAGFQVEGVKRHAFMVDGHYTDLTVMAVLSGDWHAANRVG